MDTGALAGARRQRPGPRLSLIVTAMMTCQGLFLSVTFILLVFIKSSIKFDVTAFTYD
jgi:hypothetical protein